MNLFSRKKRQNANVVVAPVCEYPGAGGAIHAPSLSMQGMFINTTQALRVGALLQAHLHLQFSNAEVEVNGIVRHVVPGAGVGIEFVEMSPEASEAISLEIDLSDPILSARRRREARELEADSSPG